MTARRDVGAAHLRLEPADPTTAPAAGLLAATAAEIAGLYGDVAGSLVASELCPPTGAYLVGWWGDEPVAAGGLRRLGEDVAEVKRMYVRPDHRGRGLAGRLLAALEDAAVSLGYRVVRLDTGPRQPHAQRLYEHAGYRRIPDYNGHAAATYWGEKVLVPLHGQRL